MGTAAPHQPQADAPGPLSSHALVYHDGLGRILLLSPGESLLDLWSWDGELWERFPGANAPASRLHFAAAYDAAEDRLLVHGGFAPGDGTDPTGRYGDLWSWSGGAWTRLHGADTGPGQRDHHAMVWDPTRQVTVAYGGGRGVPGDQTLLGDTWILDGDTWRVHEGPSPPARATHRLAWDVDRDRAVLFGGWSEQSLLSDTWQWDGSVWERASGDGPSPRFATRLAYDGELGRVVLRGGRGQEGNLGDTWEWDGRLWSLVGDAGPGARNVHALAWDRGRARLVLYGGLTDAGQVGDTWERSGRQWLRMDGPDVDSTPDGRGTAAGGWDPGAGRLLVFGGIGAEPRAYGDLWAWDPAGWSNVVPSGAAPSPRFNAASAVLPEKSQLVLYGGGALDEQRGDTWILEDGAWREHDGPGPSTRYCARMVARVDLGDAILYGGVGPDGTVFRETWRWDGAAWSKLAEDGPSGTCFHAMAWDRIRRQVVHFGGRGQTSRPSDTWGFDGTEWRLLARAGPRSRDHHAMGWDHARGEVVLFGGGGHGPGGEWDRSILDDTWAWNGSRWSERMDMGAPARFHVPLLAATESYGMLLFGGSDSTGSRADVWQWDGRVWHRLQRDRSAP